MSGCICYKAFPSHSACIPSRRGGWSICVLRRSGHHLICWFHLMAITMKRPLASSSRRRLWIRCKSRNFFRSCTKNLADEHLTGAATRRICERIKVATSNRNYGSFKLLLYGNKRCSRYQSRVEHLYNVQCHTPLGSKCVTTIELTVEGDICKMQCTNFINLPIP